MCAAAPEEPHGRTIILGGNNTGLRAIPAGGGRPTELTRTDAKRGEEYQPRYLDSGHLIFFRPAGLFAAPFDLARMRLTGAAIPVIADLFKGWDAGLNLGFFAVPRPGTLVYVPPVPGPPRIDSCSSAWRDVKSLCRRSRAGTRTRPRCPPTAGGWRCRIARTASPRTSGSSTSSEALVRG